MHLAADPRRWARMCLGGRATIPAIAVTGHASVENREHAVAVGFQLHVPKPIDPEEPATVMASVANRAAGP